MSTSALRARRLRALEVEPLRLLRRAATPVAAVAEAAPAAISQVAEAPATPVARVTTIRRLALQPDQAELGDPAIRKMYAALTEAVGKAGLQRVRACDVADDASAAVMVFGAAPLPEGVPLRRVLRADPLAVLHTDRERKRLLWERLLALGRDGSG
jgi:hypothetical protein